MVVHPKSVDTIMINDDEWRQQKDAVVWFLFTFNSLAMALQKKYLQR